MFDNLSLGRILADDTEDNTPACPFPKGRFPEDTLALRRAAGHGTAGNGICAFSDVGETL